MSSSSSLVPYNNGSQNQNAFLDEGRMVLKANIIKLLESKNALPDLIKQCHLALSTYPNLESLKKRIKYPEEIAKVNIKDLTQLIADLEGAAKTTNQIAKELLQLANYYREFQNSFTDAHEASRIKLLTPKVQIGGDLIEPYLISQEVALEMLSRNRFGDIFKKNTTGNHPVVATKEVHLKSAIEDIPLDTGMEISVYILHHLLYGDKIGTGLAPSALLTLDNVQIDESAKVVSRQDRNQFDELAGLNRRSSFYRRHPEYTLTSKPQSFAIQASTTIDGTPLSEVTDSAIQFDEENFSALLLAGFLTIPSDNNTDNFIVTIQNDKLIAKVTGIDNDMVFAYPITVDGKNEHIVGLKNALFCFDKMMDKPIASRVRDRIAQIDPILFGLEWGKAVMQQEKRLPPQSKQVKLPLRFTEHTLRELIENLQTVQKIVSNPDFKMVTHRQLFRLLFPVVERYYQQLGKHTKSTKEKIVELFSPRSPSVETCLKNEKSLEDGRTLRDALTISNKRTFAYEEERDTSIEELCLELLRTLDLSVLSPPRQSAIVSFAARNFPHLAEQELHPSWKSDTLPASLIHGKDDLTALSFLQLLGVNVNGKDDKGDTLVHLYIKQGQDLPEKLLAMVNLELRNNKRLTPLDLAMELRSDAAFISLIKAGAGTTASSSIAWEYYEYAIKKNDTDLINAFNSLVERNQNLSWKMAKEFIFPIKGNIPVVSALYGQRYLHPDVVKQLFNSDGTLTSAYFSGKREVGKATVNGLSICLKKLPELAGVEQAVGTLMHQVMGFGAPHTDLININGVPYLASQTIKGITLRDVFQNAPNLIKNVDPRRLSQLLLMTMCVNPEDGKDDNYILETLSDGTCQIVSIDNDHSFVPSVSKDANKQRRIQVKTLLYCLDQMKDPIEKTVREQFLQHDPAEILITWLTHLTNVDSLYKGIFSEKERDILFDRNGVFIGIPFRKELILELYRKMTKMQFILDQEKNNPNLSHIDLLLKIDPALGHRYSGCLSNNKNPLQRFIDIDGEDYGRKNGGLVSTRYAKEILVSYDITTEKDMKALIKSRQVLDAESALIELRKLVEQERQDLAKRLMIADAQCGDLTSLGVDEMTRLLKRVDFSKLTISEAQTLFRQIKSLGWKVLYLKSAPTVNNAFIKGLDFSKIKKLELTDCQQLTDSVVEQIVGQAPELRELNLSRNKSFQSIHASQLFRSEPAILNLNKLTHLILNKCPKLHTIMIKGDDLLIVECEDNDLQRINIKSKSLAKLNIKHNERLTDQALDETTTACPKITELQMDGCRSISEQELRKRLPFCGSQYLKSLAALGSSKLKNLSISLLLNQEKSMKIENHEWKGAEQTKVFTDALKSNTSLTELTISNLNNYSRRYQSTNFLFNDKDAECIADALKSNTTLKCLTIEYNDIGPTGAKAIAEALKHNKTLLELNLNCNSIRDEGAQYFAEVLRSNKTLRKLILSANSVYSKGVKTIAKGLESNNTLEELGLNGDIYKYSSGSTDDFSGIVELDKVHARKPFLILNVPTTISSSEITGITNFGSQVTITNRNNETLTSIHTRNKARRSQLEALKQAELQNTSKGNTNNGSSSSASDSTLPSALDTFFTELGKAFEKAAEEDPTILDDLNAAAPPKTVVKPAPQKKTDILYNQARVLESKEFDLREAIDRYLESALQNHQDALISLEKHAETEQHAQYALGCYYEAKDDIPQAAFYYAQATSGTHFLAKQALCRLAETHPAAQSHLAVLMQYGHGITENIQEAIRLHEGAAEKNIGLSQLHLGVLYHLGFSTEENKQLALSLITKAEAQGIPQADRIKAQIQKESVENERISKKAKSFDDALYYFSNRSAFSSLFSQAPKFDKAAFSRVRNKVQMESLEREKAELHERILELEGQVKDASQVTKILLGKQIQGLREDLQKLERRQIVVAEPAEEGRQYFLNQKMQLFHAGFKEKISTVLEALDAVLAGDAKRNVSKKESTAMAAFKKGTALAGKAAAGIVPFLGTAVDIAAFAAEKYVTHKQNEKIKNEYTKVQGYYPEKGLEGVAKFASLLSAGLTYRFHEFLPHLKPESLDILWTHFILTFTEYLIEKARDNASTHELIIGGSLHKCSFLTDLFSAKKLKTEYNMEWSIDDLLFSTGVITPYGGKYLPKDPKRRAFIESIKSKGKEHQKDYPIYRLGTKYEIDRLSELGIEMECIEPERIGALEAHVDSSKAGGKFLLQAEALVEQFMEDSKS